ncbi:AAA family ATPase [Streptomyces mirabilis]|uniref:AAA family ATPase n=1 Tax=Streptomyces mirabilis TaxID=68239 RepID=UPI00369941E3
MPPNSQSWGLYRGTGLPGATPEEWPEAPAWRSFGGGPELPPPPVEDPCAPAVLGTITQPLPAPPDEVARVNVALHLRRPLLVTGEPGTGKSSLAYRISGELGLGPVLRWQITSLSTLREGLYDGLHDATYDGIYDATYDGTHDATYDGTHEGRDEGGHDGGIRLGPLGTAFLPYGRPRVLLIDRLDRAEISLPEDLCTVLTAGGFSLPGGAVRCRAFPVVVITTTGERDLPSDLVRRCVTLRTQRPGPDLLRAIAANRFPAEPGRPGPAPDAVDAFVERATATEGPVLERFLDALRLAADGVLQAVAEGGNWQEAVDTLWQWTAPEEP